MSLILQIMASNMLKLQGIQANRRYRIWKVLKSEAIVKLLAILLVAMNLSIMSIAVLSGVSEVSCRGCRLIAPSGMNVLDGVMLTCSQSLQSTVSMRIIFLASGVTISNLSNVMMELCLMFHRVLVWKAIRAGVRRLSDCDLVLLPLLWR